ncbi:ABC transporter ATP-binding protein [Azospirillum sp. RWY-5-1]|uniref:ABC transporter ATP-binding protein n=1 Tax=Azospirillum oleiclasticum TaxID=2735135 RepID=A0ABX2THZ4_9PROT|nr:ABC transporter ATP-binding protein [Azospirillum oleiclasticum]NYZ14719.1 ABC transporter ATP-binding protein [Azospirillum oleiclasticum]NYZ22295.1 ABC transporter ATP-binding protein [Azospirillum oleiclasticum]
MTAPTLTASGLHLSFGGIRVLHDLDLEFRPGEITGLIGPNGAGKTSLFNCLTGAYRPEKGAILLGDRPLRGLPPAARAAHGIVRSFQTVALCPDLTVVENVMMGLARNHHAGWLDAFLPLPRGRRERAAMRTAATAALAEFGLVDAADRFPAQLPPGNQRLVEIARAIVGRPTVLLLDEPAAGLNDAETRDLTRVLQRLATPDLVMVVVEHDMDLVMGICDRIYVLNFGEFVACGTPAEVRTDPDVVRIYLGSDDD